MIRRDDLKQIALVAAAVQARPALRVLDQLELAGLHLESVHIFLGVNGAGVEEEVVRRDGEQGLGEFTDRRNQKILNVLACHNNSGVLFADPLAGVADVLDGRHIGQEQVQLVDGRGGAALAQQLVGHVGQDVEEHGVLQPLVRVHEALDSEAEELIVRDVGVAVEVFALSSHAHGMDAQADLPELALGVKVFPLPVVGVVLLLAELIEVLHGGEVPGPLLIVVRAVGDPETGVQLHQKDFDCIDLGVIEILVGPEEILEERHMLTQARHPPEGLWGSHIGIRAVAPGLGLQGVDDVLARHEVDVAAPQGRSQILILRFGVQSNDPFPGLPQVGQQQLHEIALALAGVAQDQDVAVGLVLAAPVEVRQNIGSEFVSADIDPVGIRLAGKVERVEIGRGAAGQHALELRLKLIGPHGQSGEEALQLPEGQLVHGDLGPGQLHGDVLLQFLQGVRARGLELHEHGAVQERLPVFPKLRQQLDHVLEIALRLDGFRHIVPGGHELVAAGGILNDLALFGGVHQPMVHPQRDAGAVGELSQDRLSLCGGRVFPDHPRTAVAVPEDIMVRHELDNARRDHVKEFLGAEDFRLLRGHDLGFSFHASSSSCSRYCSPSPSGIASPFMLASK